MIRLGLVAVVLTMLVASPAAGQDAAFYYVGDGYGAAPPYESGTTNPSPHVVTTSGLTGVVRSVRVRFGQWEHGNPDDLNILLVGPNGNGVVLLSDAGENDALGNGYSLSERETLVFEDAGATAPDGAGLKEGSWRPTNHFGGLGEPVNDVFPGAPAAPRKATLREAFAGSTPNGTWSLYVTDDRPGVTGSWISPAKIEITTAPAGTDLSPIAVSSASVSAPAGNRVTANVDIRRFEGFTGPVTLSLAADPRIADVSITPNPVTGNTAKVAFRIRPDAATGLGNLTLRADPNGNVAERETTPLRLTVRAPFELEGTSRPMRSCDQPFGGILTVAPDPEYTGPPVAFEFDEPSGVAVYGDEDPTAKRQDYKIYVHGKDDETFSMKVRLVAQGFPPLEREVVVEDSEVRVEDVSFFYFGGRPSSFPEVRPGPAFVDQPRGHVDVRATNLCPGTELKFTGTATAVPGTLADDRSAVLSVPIPDGAVRGPINVDSPGRGEATAAGDGIRTFRDRFQWAFPNYNETFDEEAIRDAFADATERNGSLKPWAQGLVGDVATGVCLGMTISVLRNFIGEPLPGQSHSADLFENSAPGGPSWHDARRIERNHMTQMSYQWGVAKDALAATAQTAQAYADRVAQRLAAGEPVLVEIWQGGAGHALAGYRIRPKDGGGWLIDVGDPNLPFNPADIPGEPDRLSKSTLTLETNGMWSYPGLGWSGTMKELYALPIRSVPVAGRFTMSDPKTKTGTLLTPAGTGVTDANGHAPQGRQPNLDAAGGGVTAWRVPGGKWSAQLPAGGTLGYAAAGWSAGAQPSASGPSNVVLDAAGGTVTAPGLITLSADRPGGSRVAAVDAPAGATVGFSRNEGELVLSGRGAVTVGLAAVTAKRTTAGTFRVDLKGTTRVRPSSWKRLAGTRMVVRAGKRRRVVRARKVKAGLRLGAVAAKPDGTVTVPVVATGLDEGTAHVVVKARVRGGGSATAEIGGAEGTAALKLGLRPGQRVRVTARVAGAIRGVPAGATKRRTVKVR